MIMADHDVEGHLQILLNIWSSPEWADLWAEMSCEIESFERLSISRAASDQDIWSLCQEQGIVLLTGNRNADEEESLELVIRRAGTMDSLPVLTISDPTRFLKDRSYAANVAERLLDYLLNLDSMRGAGRLYLP